MVGFLQQSGGTLLNLTDPSVIPRYFHFVVGAVAIAGLYLALIGHFNFAKSRVKKETLLHQGMNYFTIATAIEIALGFWFLLALPKNIMMLFMGGSAYGTFMLTLGIILAAAALYFGYTKKLISACVCTLVLLIDMIFMRDLVRVAYLKPYFQLSDLTVNSEYSSLALFLVIFAIGLAMIGYMLKLAFGCRKEVTK